MKNRESDFLKQISWCYSIPTPSSMYELCSSLRLCVLYVQKTKKRFLYVQKTRKRFYCSSSCLRGDEPRSESCGHGSRPTTDRASDRNVRRGAWDKPTSCPFIRTAD